MTAVSRPPETYGNSLDSLSDFYLDGHVTTCEITVWIDSIHASTPCKSKLIYATRLTAGFAITVGLVVCSNTDFGCLKEEENQT